MTLPRVPVIKTPDWERRVAEAVNSLLGGRFTVEVVTSSRTLTERDEVLLCDATSGAISITLPNADKGRSFTVKKTDASANTVTIVGTIDGAASIVLSTQYESRTVVANGTSWSII